VLLGKEILLGFYLVQSCSGSNICAGVSAAAKRTQPSQLQSSVFPEPRIRFLSSGDAAKQQTPYHVGTEQKIRAEDCYAGHTF